MPGGGLFSSQISLVFSWHVLMDARVSVDAEGTLRSKPRATRRASFVRAVLWWQHGSCACDRCIDGHQISRRDTAASRHSAHERPQWNVSAW